MVTNAGLASSLLILLFFFNFHETVFVFLGFYIVFFLDPGFQGVVPIVYTAAGFLCWGVAAALWFSSVAERRAPVSLSGALTCLCGASCAGAVLWLVQNVTAGNVVLVYQWLSLRGYLSENTWVPAFLEFYYGLGDYVFMITLVPSVLAGVLLLLLLPALMRVAFVLPAAVSGQPWGSLSAFRQARGFGWPMALTAGGLLLPVWWAVLYFNSYQLPLMVNGLLEEEAVARVALVWFALKSLLLSLGFVFLLAVIAAAFNRSVARNPGAEPTAALPLQV